MNCRLSLKLIVSLFISHEFMFTVYFNRFILNRCMFNV